MKGRTQIRTALIVGVSLLLIALPLLGACGKEVAKEVIREVPVEREVVKEVVKEVPVEKVVTKEVPKEIVVEVPVERQVVKEVVKEVPVERIIQKEVVKEVPVEKVVERIVTKEVPAPLKPEGMLRISMPLSALTPDPMIARNTQKPFMDFIFDYLIGKTPDAELSPDTGIAYKWEVSSDYMIHTFYLRKGIKFQNGEDLAADDVAFSLERIMRPEATSGYVATFRAYIDRIEIADPYKVVIYTKTPAPDLELALSAVMGPEGCIVPKDYILEKGDDYFVKHPVGSGPYKVQEVVIGSHIKLEAVDNHWLRGVPKYRTVWLWHVTEESTRIAQLKRGETDIIDVSRERAGQVEQAGYNLFVKPDATILLLFYYEMWDKDSPLADVRVREALQIAIDKEELARTLFAGQATPHGASLSAPDPSWDEKLFPPYPYDPEKARRLIAEVGYTPKIKLYSYARAGVPEIKSSAEALAGYWEKIGVKTQIVPTDYTTFRKLWGEGAGAMKPALGGGGEGAVALHTMEPRVWFFANDYKTCHSGEDISMIADPAMDRLLDSVMSEPNWEKRVDLARQWQQYKYDNFIRMAVLTFGNIFATSKDIDHWEFTPDEYGMGWESLYTRR